MQAALILAILLLAIVVAEWLARNTWLRQVGAALLVILFAAIAANLGIIPSASNAPPLYSGVFHYVAPFAIFVLLLEVDLGRLREAGLPMLAAFVIGSLATAAGTFAGLWVTPLAAQLGDLTPALGGMFTATYTGGSVNFNALALHYEVNAEGVLYAGALAVDNIMTMVWMLVTLLLPRVLGRGSKAPSMAVSPKARAATTGTIDIPGLATLLMLAAAAIWSSEVLAGALNSVGIAVPSILILTTLALVLAQLGPVKRIGGAKVIGMLALHLFLAVIGAHAEIAALIGIGDLGLTLLLFVTVLLLVHGGILILCGLFLRDWHVIAIASQANIGGATTAIALAEVFERDDLVIPAILVGSLGMALGTYLGFAVAGFLAA
ncbi:MAG: DUF819 family protein [Gammaproteobacteria bacterium]|nr:DUF819 family protein [Gammaproteobacteria bacterium]